MVLTPFKRSVVRPMATQHTHILLFCKAAILCGIVIHLLLSGPRHPCSWSCCRTLSLMRGEGRVSLRCQRGWDAGLFWVVQSYLFFFRVGAVLLPLAVSWGSLVVLTEPQLCSLQCQLYISEESSYNFIL